MRFDEAQVIQQQCGVSQRLAPGLRSALEGDGIAPAQGQDVVNLAASPERHGMLQIGHQVRVCQYEGGGTVRDQGANSKPRSLRIWA
ncbi:hypothetical protein G6F40_017621 [Rhizopus arrhizus]|nr:hypothetical protein G6F40_017621 [Rhizopus arrhizus]